MAGVTRSGAREHRTSAMGETEKNGEQKTQVQVEGGKVRETEGRGSGGSNGAKRGGEKRTKSLSTKCVPSPLHP